MNIAKDCVVSIHYTLTGEDGAVIDSSRDSVPLEYVHGNGQLIPGLERQLEGRTAGETFSAVIGPAEAYGEYNEKWVQVVPKSQFDPSMKIEVGMEFQADTATGPVVVTVTKIDGDSVTVDANHELAGKKLRFDVEVVSVRAATEDELFEISGGGCGSCSGGCGGGSCSGGGCSGCGGGCA